MNFNEVNTFWFEETAPEDWFNGSPEMDKLITNRFGDAVHAARSGELADWRETIQGRLAEIILIDQFSRSIFRGTGDAFSHDSMALALSQEAIRAGSLDELTDSQRAFLYMPFMHSESLRIHEDALKLFSEKGLEYNLEFEIQHKNIIECFGRYPSRNKDIGRESTSEEIAFLENEHSGF